MRGPGVCWCDSGAVAHRSSRTTCQLNGCDNAAAHELECLEPTGIISRDLLLCDEHEEEFFDVECVVLSA